MGNHSNTTLRLRSRPAWNQIQTRMRSAPSCLPLLGAIFILLQLGLPTCQAEPMPEPEAEAEPEGCDFSDDAWSICNTDCQKSRNRTLVEGENCGENDDGVLLETVACEDGNCTKDAAASSPKIETVPFTLFLGLLFFAFAK